MGQSSANVPLGAWGEGYDVPMSVFKDMASFSWSWPQNSGGQSVSAWRAHGCFWELSFLWNHHNWMLMIWPHGDQLANGPWETDSNHPALDGGKAAIWVLILRSKSVSHTSLPTLNSLRPGKGSTHGVSGKCILSMNVLLTSTFCGVAEMPKQVLLPSSKVLGRLGLHFKWD